MRLLVHADASRQWEPAAGICARLARATKGHVTVLTSERVKRKQSEVLRRAEQVVGLPRSQLKLAVQPGLVEHVVPVAANSGSYDLVVLGPLGGLDWLTHGHILSRLVAHTGTSTLLVRGAGSSFAKALVGTEGGESGAVTTRAALDVASTFDMEVHVLHVLSQIAIYDFIKEQPDVEFLESEHPMAQHLRDLRMTILRSGARGEAKARVGPVQDEILAELREGGYDLLVVGAHHTSPAEHFLTRDISAWLLRHCPVSTLVVREPWRWPRPRGAP